MNQLPPHRHGGAPPPRHPLSWRRFLQLGVAFLVVGLAGGLLFSRADPDRAARLVVAEFTTSEDGPAESAGPDPVTPVTGPHRGAPTCGRNDGPLGVEAQVATLASGVTVVQHRPDLPPEDDQRLDRLAERDRVVVAPNTDLPDGVVVVATAWRQRMPLERIDLELLGSFVQGHADRAPALADCP